MEISATGAARLYLNDQLIISGQGKAAALKLRQGNGIGAGKTMNVLYTEWISLRHLLSGRRHMQGMKRIRPIEINKSVIPPG